MRFAVLEILVIVNTKCFPELALWKSFDIKSSFQNNSCVMPQRASEDNLSFSCHSSYIFTFKVLVQSFDYKDKNVEIECITELKMCPVKSCCWLWSFFILSEWNGLKLERGMPHADWEVNDNFKLSTIC